MKDHWKQLLRGDSQATEDTPEKKSRPVSKHLKSENFEDPEETYYVPPTPNSVNPPLMPQGAAFMSLDDARAIASARQHPTNKYKIAKTEFVNNIEELEHHQNSIAYKIPKGIKRVPWLETLGITVERPVLNVDEKSLDSINQENRFHDITLLGVSEALRRLKSAGITFTRPQDFYAEMLKTDQQMLKVRTNLASETARIQAVERRKKDRVEKKFAKKVHADKTKQKQMTKNKNLLKIEEWKKSKCRAPLK